MTRAAHGSVLKTRTQSLRLDRLVSLCLVRSGNAPHSAVAPILMYHSIDNETERGRHAYYRTVTSPKIFADQMAFLKSMNYSTIGLQELSRRLEQGADCSRHVAITFDDGYRDFYRNAFPVLAQFGFTATVFLVTDFVADAPHLQGSHPARQLLNGKECMTWDEVRDMHRNGVSFGSHSLTHPQLRDLHMGAVAEQLRLSKERIEQELGCAVDSFAYPYAFPEADSDFVSCLRTCIVRAGYLYGVCSSVGRVDRTSDRLFMRRLPVNSCDDLALFKAKLCGAYDWVGKLQFASKTARALIHLHTPSMEALL